MSVRIKNMEMPEHCGYCRFRYDGICHALQKTQYAVTDCPLEEEKTGRWGIEKLKQSRYLVRCSVCGKEYVDEYDSYIDARKFNYCPNCGARMFDEDTNVLGKDGR